MSASLPSLKPSPLAPPRVTHAPDAPEAVRRAAAVLAAGAAVEAAEAPGDGAPSGALHVSLHADGPDLRARIDEGGTGTARRPRPRCSTPSPICCASGGTHRRAARRPARWGSPSHARLPVPPSALRTAWWRSTAHGARPDDAGDGRGARPRRPLAHRGERARDCDGLRAGRGDGVLRPVLHVCARRQPVRRPTLTRGIYPPEYLAANRTGGSKLAAAGRAYGLTPGMCCFEPRSSPRRSSPATRRSAARAWTTRSGRTCRATRSRRTTRPRATTARQMMRALMAAVPDLAYLSVWTNDSGAGFEHTSACTSAATAGRTSSASGAATTRSPRRPRQSRCAGCA